MPQYDTAQYSPPSTLIRSVLGCSTSGHPVTEYKDIHQTPHLLLDNFDHEALVYVHISFAQGLQTTATGFETDVSDVNLYILSHTRQEFEITLV
jgi:hypothetical protein